ncbi:S9 family peptidase [Lamprobacter modestohalophilus]|uniref:S9 family peptidase n=1 Tax=Lamprobacter modestohalophilus TaxID=1064514 RepID=UPI002ADED2CB|nr:S9 family peptidase [Lamprobacter modestohalophilus]MEA1051008.1 S9 family peptidase [Lamprobacter modestohalophilus]
MSSQASDSAPDPTAADAGSSGLPTLIPREVLFGNPTRAQARLSPDGRHLSWLAPSADDVLNVWVQPADRSQEARQITNDQKRGIRSYGWTEDGTRILYVQDEGGDENWHLYAAPLDGSEARDLTPFEGVRAQNLMTDPKHPNEILVGLNQRDPSVFDMYRVQLDSGKVALDTENPGDVVSWLTDAEFRIRAAEATDPETGDDIIRVRDEISQPWRELLRFPFGENGGALAFNDQGDQLFVTSSLGSDTTRLLALDLKTGKPSAELARHAKADVGSVIMHPTEHRVQAVEFDYLKPEWMIIDPSIADDVAYLEETAEGTVAIVSRTLADDRWVFVDQPDDGPAAYYLYDREPRKAERLFVTRPELAEYDLAKMQPLEIQARDGLTLPSYLTLPLGLEPKQLPLVLLVHGGPWARDDWGYSAQAQWLANRGYAVLQVNFRGSTGFGKAFLNAGNEEWGVGAMQHDLTDAVRWAIEQGIADPERVCIYGGSYGGYATLAGLAFTPDLYACGVDIVGPSNIETLFQSVPPYWAPMKKQLVKRVGDVENDPELNRRISPLFHAEKIEAPLMVLQGANDPRVKIAEADQIVAAMREKDLPVTYIVFPDEGHGFARPENRLDANARIEQFLAEQLGGRAEPITPIEGSTAEER